MKKPDCSKIGVNPYTESLIIPVSRKEFANQYKKDGDLLVPVTSEVEQTPFTKFYVSPERRMNINSLSLRAKEMFLWICYELDPGIDYIWINKERYMKEQGIKDETYRLALKELQAQAILTPSTINSVYWFNPNYFFRGDRVAKFSKNVQVLNPTPRTIHAPKPTNWLSNVQLPR